VRSLLIRAKYEKAFSRSWNQDDLSNPDRRVGFRHIHCSLILRGHWRLTREKRPFQRSALKLRILVTHGHNGGRYISLERIVEQSKESYYEALQTSSVGWHDGSHDIMPWFHYFLSTIHTAYREFEERVVQ